MNIFAKGFGMPIGMLVAVAFAAWGSVAVAETGVSAPLRIVAPAKSVAGKGAARFDGRKGGATLTQAELATPVTRTASLGRGAWICSPAGFGSKSKCFQR